MTVVRSLGVLALTLAVSACGNDYVPSVINTGVAVITYRAPDADFGTFSTYAIASKITVVNDTTGTPEYSYQAAPEILAAIERNMAARGYLLVARVDPENPSPLPVDADLAMNVSVFVGTDYAYVPCDYWSWWGVPGLLVRPAVGVDRLPGRHAPHGDGKPRREAAGAATGGPADMGRSRLLRAHARECPERPDCSGRDRPGLRPVSLPGDAVRALPGSRCGSTGPRRGPPGREPGPRGGLPRRLAPVPDLLGSGLERGRARDVTARELHRQYRLARGRGRRPHRRGGAPGRRRERDLELVRPDLPEPHPGAAQLHLHRPGVPPPVGLDRPRDRPLLPHVGRRAALRGRGRRWRVDLDLAAGREPAPGREHERPRRGGRGRDPLHRGAATRPLPERPVPVQHDHDRRRCEPPVGLRPGRTWPTTSEPADPRLNGWCRRPGPGCWTGRR